MPNQINNGFSASTISATTFYGNGSNLTGVSGGGTFNGGTVTGATIFTGGVTANTINLSTTTTGATHQNLGLNAAGRITRIGNSSNETFVYSFANGADNLDFYNDGNVRFGWDAPGNDLEFYMDVEPAGGTDMRSLATINYATQQNTFVTTVGVLYDIYGAGVPAGSQLTAIIVAETDPTYPIYQVDLYNASSNVTVKITKTKKI